MTPVVREWVRKAEEDWEVAQRERQVAVHPANAVICFHAQQCAEKYIKAVLIDRVSPLPRSMTSFGFAPSRSRCAQGSLSFCADGARACRVPRWSIDTLAGSALAGLPALR